jgi:hypothetical protein
MIIKLFKTTQPLTIALLLLISIGMWGVSWGLHFRIVEANGMPLYDFVLFLLKGAPVAVFSFLGFVLFTTQAIHLNLILNKHEVLYKSSWLPALSFLLIAGLLPSFLGFHPLLFVNSILLFALDKIFSLYKKPDPLSVDFDSSFLLALAALFYFPAVFLFLIYLIGIVVLRSFSWRDWVVGILGFILPFFFAFMYYFFNDGLNGFYDRLLITGLSRKIDFNHLHTYEYTFSILIVGILFVLSLFRLQSNYFKNITKARLIQQLFLLLIITGILSILVSREEQLYRFQILAIPLTVYVAYFFLSGKKNWISELVFLVLAGGWIYNYLFIR